MSARLSDNQLRALGRAVVEAAATEWHIAVLASCWRADPETPPPAVSELVSIAGRARRHLGEVGEQIPDLEPLHLRAEDPYARRHHLMHDVVMEELIASGDDLRPSRYS